MTVECDDFIIGSGQAGVPLSTRLAKTGRKVVVAERGDVGGTCINTGCTPTKTLIASATVAHEARRAKALGVEVGEVKVNLAAVIDRKNKIVSEWREGIASQLQSTENLTLVRGHARFVGPRELEVAGTRYRAKRVVINVGTRPVVPGIPGLDGTPFLDNATLMALKELPRHLVVIGGGYIGCELGQAYRRFGSEVTIIDGNPHLLGRVDEDISAVIEEVFRAEGITLELGAKIERVSGKAGEVTVSLGGGRSVRGTDLMVATGRRPNTDDLGLDKAGVAMDDRGFVKVDARYRTNVDDVYAVGDCNGEPQFTHTSWDDHRILFDLLNGVTGRTREGRVIPWVTFTDPQVAGVGLSEAEAKKKGFTVEVAKLPVAHVARASEVNRTEGLLKAIVDPDTEKIIGAVFVGAEAGELIHILVPLMQAGISPRAIVDAQVAHPSWAEGVQSLFMSLDRFKLKEPKGTA